MELRNLLSLGYDSYLLVIKQALKNWSFEPPLRRDRLIILHDKTFILKGI